MKCLLNKANTLVHIGQDGAKWMMLHIPEAVNRLLHATFSLIGRKGPATCLCVRPSPCPCLDPLRQC